MKIPVESVRVGPFDFRFIQLTDVQAINLHGELDPQNHTIALSPQFASLRHMAETAWHEITHAIAYVADIQESDAEERVVTRISLAQASFVRDNPQFMRWFVRVMG